MRQIQSTYNTRGIAQMDATGASGTVQVTAVNAYSGNNGRAVVLDSTNTVCHGRQCRERIRYRTHPSAMPRLQPLTRQRRSFGINMMRMYRTHTMLETT